MSIPFILLAVIFTSVAFIYMISYITHKILIDKNLNIDYIEIKDKLEKLFNRVNFKISNNKHVKIFDFEIMNYRIDFLDKEKYSLLLDIYSIIKNIEINNILTMNVKKICDDIKQIDEHLLQTFIDYYGDLHIVILEMKNNLEIIFNSTFIQLEYIKMTNDHFHGKSTPLINKNQYITGDVCFSVINNFYSKETICHEMEIIYKMKLNRWFYILLLYSIVKFTLINKIKKKPLNYSLVFEKSYLYVYIFERLITKKNKEEKIILENNNRPYIFDLYSYKNWLLTLHSKHLNIMNELEKKYTKSHYYKALDSSQLNKSDLLYIITQIEKINDKDLKFKFKNHIKLNNQLSLEDLLNLEKYGY